MKVQNKVLLGGYFAFVDDAESQWLVIASTLTVGMPEQVFFGADGENWCELYLAKLNARSYDFFDAALLDPFTQRAAIVLTTCARQGDELRLQNRLSVLRRRDDVPLAFKEVSLIDDAIAVTLKDYVRSYNQNGR